MIDRIKIWLKDPALRWILFLMLCLLALWALLILIYLKVL